ncbi:hypothetical protein [uncultured Microbacterium sp.]|uniref:hypothetical protein n=1 Tax=uncultured Microbacterium sp. TaxID=191216 RepID=UPI0035CA00E3
MNTSHALRYSVIAFGAALLVSAGTAAVAADENPGDAAVDVKVDIQEIAEPGVLALSVDTTSTSLTENGSTDLVRQFTGTLPTVTVTDTRTAAATSWSLMGSASDFTQTGSASSIGADHLGWAPAVIIGDGDPAVSVGGDVDGSLDGGPGLKDQELLFLADSAAAVGGTWSANADLKLKVPADVEPGSYTSVLTLSLFE